MVLGKESPVTTATGTESPVVPGSIADLREQGPNALKEAVAAAQAKVVSDVVSGKRVIPDYVDGRPNSQAAKNDETEANHAQMQRDHRNMGLGKRVISALSVLLKGKMFDGLDTRAVHGDINPHGNPRPIQNGEPIIK